MRSQQFKAFNFPLHSVMFVSVRYIDRSTGCPHLGFRLLENFGGLPLAAEAVFVGNLQVF